MVEEVIINSRVSQVEFTINTTISIESVSAVTDGHILGRGSLLAPTQPESCLRTAVRVMFAPRSSGGRDDEIHMHAKIDYHVLQEEKKACRHLGGTSIGR